MATLFEETTINGMTLRNRMVRSATWEGMCEQDGRPTERLINCYKDLAKGGIGLIITGYAFVRLDGKNNPGQMGIHTDNFADDYKKMTKAVHEAGGKIAVQLVHGGGQSNAEIAGRQSFAPSAVKVSQFPEMPVELTRDEISKIITAFGEAARRAKSWGVDAIQLHGAHGFLINQFLSPLTNRRTDEYGGSIENRSRFLLEVYRNVRETVGADYPVLIKLNASDHVDGGLEIDDSVYAAKKLAEAGINTIEVSAGTSASGEKSPVRRKINKSEKEAYNLKLARRIKEAVSCLLMVVGGFRSYRVAEKAIRDYCMDYISMARPLIREPGLANRWLQGDRKRAMCISCNKCFMPGREEGGIYCVIEKKKQEKAAKKTSEERVP
ncbi:MAG: NADH:flavin oxidoreductase [Nitrospirota bacterium]|nr:NADH:flavin oxidoreductase [Nitrospirota bacterium]